VCVKFVHRPNSMEYFFAIRYVCLLMLGLVLSNFIIKKLAFDIF
jgi:hypothetical protein